MLTGLQILFKPVKQDSQGRVILPKTKRQINKSSVMDFPDELLVMVASNLADSSSKYCLALSCKRLLAVVTEMDATTKPKLALQANNKSGPWKEQLMVALARGWIPKHKLKLCFACWRFMPYGRASKKKYLAMEKERTCHLRMKEWINNWEVKIWLRELRVAGDWKSFIADFRLRCPMCVLENHDLHLRNKKFKDKARKGDQLRAVGNGDVQPAVRSSKGPKPTKPRLGGEPATVTRSNNRRWACEPVNRTNPGRPTTNRRQPATQQVSGNRSLRFWNSVLGSQGRGPNQR